MSDNPTEKIPPGDHGHFGLDNATEDYKRLKDTPKPSPNPDEVNNSAS